MGMVPQDDRLVEAALLIVTILVHGAAAVSIGLALATAIRRPRIALAAMIGLSMFLILGLPIGFFIGRNLYESIFTFWGFLLMATTLLNGLVTRLSGDIPEISAWMMLWDGVLAVLSVALVWATVRFGRGRLLGESKAKRDPGSRW